MKRFRFNEIFKYNEYIENIDNVSAKEIDDMYHIFCNYIITEGLISTYPSQKTEKLLRKKYIQYDIQLMDDGDIYILGDITNYEDIKKLINTLGYFISFVYINDEWIKYDEKYLDDIKGISIEPKYDTELEILPKYLYHVTQNKYLNKILKIGLIPKHHDKLTHHPDRIYVSNDLKSAQEIKMFIEKTYDTEASILIIDTSDLHNKFYSDVNLRQDGFYTLNNISPKNIKPL